MCLVRVSYYLIFKWYLKNKRVLSHPLHIYKMSKFIKNENKKKTTDFFLWIDKFEHIIISWSNSIFLNGCVVFKKSLGVGVDINVVLYIRKFEDPHILYWHPKGKKPIRKFEVYPRQFVGYPYSFQNFLFYFN